ncbi:MAG: hypothetical protein ABIH35_03565 [Patescibacteria group bacterium]
MVTHADSLSHHHTRLTKLHARIHRKKNFFPGQREGEEVQLCVRTHWIRDLRVFVWFLLMAVVVPAIILYLFSFVNISPNGWSIINLILTGYLLLAWLLAFVEFQKNELTVLVSTNERIADIVQKSLFNQQISETNLDRIQEVTGFTHGLLGTFLDVGKLEIQTAGSELPLVMRNVKSPQLTSRKILDIQQDSQKRRRTSDFGKRQNDELSARKGERLSQAELAKLRSSSEPQRKPENSV